MPRSMWSGEISWGMISIPAKLYKATDDHASPFHQVHKADGGRITMRRFCATCEEEVPWENITKGFHTADSETIQVTDDELAALPVPTAKAIQILHFTDPAGIDPALTDGQYYTSPAAKASQKAYALLRETLASTGLVAVCKIALRTREVLAVLVPRGDMLSLVTLRWPSEIREHGLDLPAGEATAGERKMARQLVMAGVEDFDPGRYTDEYAEAVDKLIEAKTKKKAPPKGRARARAEATPDLGAALEASLAAMAETKPKTRTRQRKPATRRVA